MIDSPDKQINVRIINKTLRAIAVNLILVDPIENKIRIIHHSEFYSAIFYCDPEEVERFYSC